MKMRSASTVPGSSQMTTMEKTGFDVANALNGHTHTQHMRTERGGSVVTQETRIREVPGSNPGGDQPDWGFFVVFLSHRGKCWVGFSLPRSI